MAICSSRSLCTPQIGGRFSGVPIIAIQDTIPPVKVNGVPTLVTYHAWLIAN
jgi:hypothetical protein